jgi:pantothenate kinase
MERIKSGGGATSFATAMYKQRHIKVIDWSNKITNQMKLDRLKGEIDNINIIINDVKHL